MQERGRPAYLQIDLFLEYGLYTLDKSLHALPIFERKLERSQKKQVEQDSCCQKDQCYIWLTFFLVNGKMYTFHLTFVTNDIIEGMKGKFTVP